MKRSSLVMLLAAACASSPAAEPQQQPDPKPVKAEVVQVSERTLEKMVQLPGELFAYEWVALHARVSGFVEEVLVDRGSEVRKGEVLVRLSAPELAAQRAEAEAKVEGTKTTLQHLRAASATPGVVAGHEVEIAKSALDADEAKVRALRTMEGYLVVRAPFDGVITERDVHPGALVGPSAGPLVKMAQTTRLRLNVAVPEQFAAAISEGASATFTVPAWPGIRFSGPIRRVSHDLETKTRTMPIEIDVDNRSGKLAPGMYADVAWPLQRQVASLFVPAGALLQTAEQTFVDKVQDGVVQRVAVQRGVATSDSLEVFGPLHAGDFVLARASEELRDGSKVNAVLKKSPGASR
jgi:RND family efflux transporter MFP subunit